MSKHDMTARDGRPARLIVSARALENGVRNVLIEPDTVAVGRVRRHLTAEAREYLIDDLETIRNVPRGKTRPPLDDWCLVATASTLDALDELLTRVDPPSTQLLVVLLIDRNDRRQLSATVHSHGRVASIDEVRFVGPGMVTVGHLIEPTDEGDAGLAERWSRTAGALGMAAMARLRQTTVTLVGAGRTGSQLAFQLAALGVGRLRLVDPDVLEMENLDAMPGLTPADVGLPKACALAQRLLEFRPDMAVTWLAQSVKDSAAAELVHRRTDLLVTCVDDNMPRLAIAVAARETLTVHLDVACNVMRDEDGELDVTADTRLLLPGQGCAACVGPMADLEDAAYQLAAPAGSLRKGPQREWFEQRAGSLVTINAIAVGTAVQLWLDLLQGRVHASVWNRLRWVPGQALNSRELEVSADQCCSFCT